MMVMSILDPDTARAQLDRVKERYDALITEWESYETDLERAVKDADPVLPLWEIAERSGRHRNFVSQWTSVRRRSNVTADSK
jgi:hypothetical protein